MTKVGVYGWNGYLGKSICTRYPAYRKLERFSLLSDSLDLVIDCSFPNGNLKKSEVTQYLKLISERVSFYKSKSVNYLYLGSYSSIKPINNSYGKIKCIAEQIVLEHGGTVVKLGLVINTENPGGRFSELVRILHKLPILVTPHEKTFEIFIDNEFEIIESVQNWQDLQTSCTYLLKTCKRSNLGTVARNASPGKPALRLNLVFSKALEYLVRFSPTDLLGPLKGISVKRNLNSDILEIANDR